MGAGHDIAFTARSGVARWAGRAVRVERAGGLPAASGVLTNVDDAGLTLLAAPAGGTSTHVGFVPWPAVAEVVLDDVDAHDVDVARRLACGPVVVADAVDAGGAHWSRMLAPVRWTPSADVADGPGPADGAAVAVVDGPRFAFGTLAGGRVALAPDVTWGQVADQPLLAHRISRDAEQAMSRRAADVRRQAHEDRRRDRVARQRALVAQLAAAGVRHADVDDEAAWPDVCLWREDVSEGPVTLVLAMDLERFEPGMVFDPSRQWVALAHQGGGYACTQTRLVATVLTPRDDVAGLLASLAHQYLDSCLVAPASLTAVTEYAGRLAQAGLSCDAVHMHLAEGVYPLDLRCLGAVAADVLPDDLDELVTFPTSLARLLGSVGRWRLLALGDNCD